MCKKNFTVYVCSTSRVHVCLLFHILMLQTNHTELSLCLFTSSLDYPLFLFRHDFNSLKVRRVVFQMLLYYRFSLKTLLFFNIYWEILVFVRLKFKHVCFKNDPLSFSRGTYGDICVWSSVVLRDIWAVMTKILSHSGCSASVCVSV